MATKTKKSKKPSGLSYATAVSNEKYAPQIAEIKGLYDQAKQQYASDIDSARNAATSGVAFAAAARPKTISDYGAAASTTSKINDLVNSQVTGSSGGISDVYRAALADEQGGQVKKIANEKANALQGLTNQETSAASGQQFAQNQAKANYQKTADTLSQKLVDIAGQQGNEIAVQLGKLQQANAKTGAAAKTDASKLYTSGAFNGKTHGEVAKLSAQDRAQIVAKFNQGKGKKAAGGVTRATPDKREALNTEVGGAINDWNRIATAQKGMSSQQIAQLLTQGQTPTTDNPNGGIKKRQAIAITIAQEVAAHGHISSATAQKLHSLGYKTTDIDNLVTQNQAAKNRTANQSLSSTHGWGY